MSDDDFMCMDSSGEEEDGGLDFEEEDIGFSAGEEEEAGHTSVASKPTNSYQILTMDMISKKMFEIIHEVNAVFHVSQHDPCQVDCSAGDRPPPSLLVPPRPLIPPSVPPAAHTSCQDPAHFCQVG